MINSWLSLERQLEVEAGELEREIGAAVRAAADVISYAESRGYRVRSGITGGGRQIDHCPVDAEQPDGAPRSGMQKSPGLGTAQGSRA
jgi:hypothetical protein